MCDLADHPPVEEIEKAVFSDPEVLSALSDLMKSFFKARDLERAESGSYASDAANDDVRKKSGEFVGAVEAAMMPECADYVIRNDLARRLIRSHHPKKNRGYTAAEIIGW